MARKDATSSAHCIPNRGDGANPKSTEQRKDPDDHRYRPDDIGARTSNQFLIGPLINQDNTREHNRHEDAVRRHTRAPTSRSGTSSPLEELGTHVGKCMR